MKAKNAFAYEFAYEVHLLSETRIGNLSLPKHAEIKEQDEARTNILVSSSRPSRQIDLFYRTLDMMAPQLSYAESEGQVAVSVSLVPTFDPV